jgi:hypothetical protein
MVPAEQAAATSWPGEPGDASTDTYGWIGLEFESRFWHTPPREFLT